MYRLLLFLLCNAASIIGVSQTVDFSYQLAGNSSCAPSTVQFTQKCTGSPVGFIWGVGSQKYYDPNPMIPFIMAGTYTITLTAVYEKQSATITKTIIIYPAVTASIDFDRNYLCQPGNINFNANTTGNIQSYVWDFGDSTPVLTLASPAATHNFAKFGTFNVLLTVISNSGCTTTARTTIIVQPLTATGKATRLSGCVPASTRLSVIIQAPAKSVVTNYAWNFDDGSPVLNTTTRATTQTYNSTGRYAPSVKATTSEGCTTTFNFDTLKFGTPPKGIIAYPQKAIICGGENAVLYANAANADLYRWTFGDGRISNRRDTIVTYTYDSLGVKNLIVVPSFNGCSGLPAKFSITVKGVIASFDYSNTCSDKKTFAFKNTSQGNVSSSLWSFNNLFPTSNATNVTKTFPDSGAFRVQLDVTDNISGCKDRYAKFVYTANPVLINTDSFICKNSISSFKILGNYAARDLVYNWNVFGRNINNDSVATRDFIADTLGNFTNGVVINYREFVCPDTILLNHKILVGGPLLNFTAPASICLNTAYSVVNLSKPFVPSDAITNFQWRLSDKANIDTAYQPAPYLNLKTGTFKATVSASDINGCIDTLVKTYTVNRMPFLHIQNSIDTVCLGQRDTLIAFHSDSIRWLPSSLFSCINCDTVIIKPAQTMRLYATATSVFNCIATDSSEVKVFGPFVATAPQNNYYICKNESVQLVVDSLNNTVVWTPGTGLSNTNIYKPIATPLQHTTYTATVTDSANCFSSTATVNVVIKTQPTVNAGPDAVYPHNTNFSFAPVYSSNVVSYEWKPFENINCNTCAVPTGTTDQSKTYSVTVVSDSGCMAIDSVKIGVQCSDASMFMATAFSPNNDYLNDYYFPLAKGIKMVTRFAIYNRLGEIVFEAKNFPPNNKAFGWNGKFKGQDQPLSTYLYIMDAICELGETVQKHGSFVLLR